VHLDTIVRGISSASTAFITIFATSMPGTRIERSGLLITVALALLATLPVTAAPDSAVALVAGKPIREKELDERTAPRLRELNTKIFEVREQALNEMIDEQLTHQEAGRLELSVQQLLNNKVDSHIEKPTSADIERYYASIKDRINLPLNEDVRSKILDFLTNSRRRIVYDSYLRGLRSRAAVVVLLSPPRTVVSLDPMRVRGPVGAPITIVEFSDFECPYCRGAEDTLRQLLSRYPIQIRLAYRDLPLKFHPHAEPAALASHCALAQGKYWQYHDLLFENQEHLDGTALSDYAVRLGMNPKQFDECMTQKTYATEVQRDLDDGQMLGITGTPAFFINGVAINGAISLEEFSRVIDRELDRTKSANYEDSPCSREQDR
jgi:protein-disulfide isomerase